MSTYGDRGNIIVLQKIAEKAGLEVEIKYIEQSSEAKTLLSCDLLFMGGAQDLQQEIVMQDLLGEKGKILKQLIENETPGLFICGAYQFLGNYYKDAYGTKIAGLGIFDMFSESDKKSPRLIGNIVAKSNIANSSQDLSSYLVGFENHGGRTYLNDTKQAFAKVIVGFGNNGKDKTEGIHYKNSIGTYLHGPILPSNPKLAISLLQTAYVKKYSEKIIIDFNDNLSQKAKLMMLKRLKTNY